MEDGSVEQLTGRRAEQQLERVTSAVTSLLKMEKKRL